MGAIYKDLILSRLILNRPVCVDFIECHHICEPYNCIIILGRTDSVPDLQTMGSSMVTMRSRTTINALHFRWMILPIKWHYEALIG